MAALVSPTLCLVTDRRRSGGWSLDDLVSLAVAGGANMVQLREPDLPAADIYALARRLRRITDGRALLFVNDRIDLALAVPADGVQLPERGLPPDVARRVSGGLLLIGRSVHDVEGAVKAQSDGADLLVVGTIFATASHPGAAPQGLALLTQLRPRVTVPTLAIGGITAANIRSVIDRGASGAAVIGAVAESSDPEGATRDLVHGMRAAWESRLATPGRRRT